MGYEIPRFALGETKLMGFSGPIISADAEGGSMREFVLLSVIPVVFWICC